MSQCIAKIMLMMMACPKKTGDQKPGNYWTKTKKSWTSFVFGYLNTCLCHFCDFNEANLSKNMCPGEQAQHIFRIQGDPCLEKPDLPESQVRPAHLKTTCLLPSTNFSPPPPPLPVTLKLLTLFDCPRNWRSGSVSKIHQRTPSHSSISRTRNASNFS